MSSFVIERSDLYPVGTVVSVYLITRPESGVPISGVPPGSVVTEATVGATGKLTFIGLTAGSRYIAYAVVNGAAAYLRFQVTAPSEEGSSGYALVGSDGTVGGPLGSPLSSAVLTSTLKELGEVSGAITPKLSEGDVFTLTATGNVTIKCPSGTPPRAVFSVILALSEDAAGAHTFTFEGFGVLGEAPKLNTGSNAVNVVELLTLNGGVTWYLVGLQAGKEGAAGATGATGPEGPEGFNPEPVTFPSAWEIFKSSAESGTENKKVVAEPYERSGISTTYLLVSGTGVLVMQRVKAKTVISGLAFAITTEEGTAANRTHLWGALLDSEGKVLKLTPDYTSSTTNKCATNTRRGLKFESTYEMPANGVLYAVLCEVMSSTSPITIAAKTVGNLASEAAPQLMGTTATGRTNPASLATTVPSGAGTGEKLPYIALV